MTGCRHCATGRRDFVKIALGLGAGAALPGAALPGRGKAKSVILLWMQGGPSQLDTWDPKPGAATGGPFKALDTATPGVRVSEHLPRLARASGTYSVIRTLTSKDPNHDTARYLLHTGHRTDPTLEHPHLGSLLSQELGTRAEGLPGCITLGKDASTAGSGYLSPDTAPLTVEKIENPLEDLKPAPGVTRFRLEDREALLAAQNASFGTAYPDPRLEAQRNAYERAFSLMRSPHLKAFDLTHEDDATKRLYGHSPFGKACLMARRLVEAGVRFIEVTLADWDTHQDNFGRSKKLMDDLDPAMSGLLEDLRRRGLLDETLVLWAGEFGRTPRINGNQGRDHWTRAFSAVLAGGGVAGGRVVGRTDPTGQEALERPVSVQDLFATVYGLAGVQASKKYPTPAGRPVMILEGGEPVKEILA
jgi:hypothetical protein